MCYKCVINVLSVFYQCSLNGYKCFISVLSVCYKWL